MFRGPNVHGTDECGPNGSFAQMSIAKMGVWHKLVWVKGVFSPIVLGPKV